MSKDSILDSLGRIDDYLIQSVEALRQKKKHPEWKKWGIMAACLGLIVASAFVVSRITHTGSSAVPESDGVILQDEEPTVSLDQSVLLPDDEENPNREDAEDVRTPWTVHFNEATSVMSASRAYIQGYFTEALDEAELAELEPAMRFAFMSYTGYAGYDQNGNLLDVIMTVTSSVPDHPVTVSIADYSFGASYILPGETIASFCNKVEYRVYLYETGKTITLAADAIINDLYYHFSMDTSNAELEQAKTDFQCILECFACYEEGKPDLSLVVPEKIPELTEIMFSTLPEAQAEPDFGKYLPSELPVGFGDAIIRRFQFQNSNSLSGMWSRGMDDLSWVIRPYTEEDAERLTGVEDKENYDLSLYPIPRAQSVPDELREIVQDPIFEAEELTMEAVWCRAYKANDAGDTAGWRMRFSVRYGNVVVSVSAKGVEPEWVYRQLCSLPSE